MSSHVFVFEGIDFFLEYAEDDQEFFVFSSAWGDPDFDDPDDMGPGYWFPVKDKMIVWDHFPTNSKEIPREVMRAADTWVQKLES